MVRAAERYVRILIRRPHAYGFVAEHAPDEEPRPIPGIVFLDPEGRLRGSVVLWGEDCGKNLLREMQDLAKGDSSHSG